MVSDERKGLAALCLRSGLWALSGVYALFLAGRGWFDFLLGYQAPALDCPVVSVGNITWGGTGKTPLVALVVKKLKGLGFRPAVITRAGVDEASLLKEGLDGVPVLLDRNRFRAGRMACERFSADCLVLDDGFQQRSLKKSLELVVLNARMPFGNGNLIPRGMLRVPPARLRNAHWILLNKADSITPEEKGLLLDEVRALSPHAQVGEAVYRVTHITSLQGGGGAAAADFSGKRVGLAAAIGDPQSFRSTVRGLGIEVCWEQFWPDHHAFSDRELAQGSREAARAGADALLVTEKDAVKIRPWLKSGPRVDLPIFAVGIRMDIISGEQDLDGLLRGLPRG